METKMQNKRTKQEIVEDIVCGVAQALAYTEEEIYDTFSKEDAEEFINLRKEYMANIGMTVENEYDSEQKSQTSLAAEKKSGYDK